MEYRLFYNPFFRIAGWRAFYIGFGGLLLISLLAFATGTHYNGLFQIEYAKDSPVWFYFYENLSHWFVFSTIAYVVGVAISKSSIRAIDVYGTSLLAKMPFILVPLVRILPPFQSFAFQSPLILIVNAMFWLSLVYVCVLLYNSIKVSCNLKSEKLLIAFIVIVLTTEVLLYLLAITLF